MVREAIGVNKHQQVSHVGPREKKSIEYGGWLIILCNNASCIRREPEPVLCHTQLNHLAEGIPGLGFRFSS